jgi:hypothetical protein
MKNSIAPAVVCCFIFAAYVLGQANQKPVEPCCCKHLQQIADDLHWIRESMSKPFIPPPNSFNVPHSGKGGEFKDPGNINEYKIEPIDLGKPDFKSPPKPEKPKLPRK